MTGQYRIEAPRETVWEALNDVEVLRLCIPGVEEIEKTSDTSFTAKVRAKVGPVSARFAGELLKAQAWIPGHIAAWNHPLLVILAGEDKVADTPATRTLLKEIDPGLLTELYYPDNFHENFNELNREEIFARIVEWCEPRIV